MKTALTIILSCFLYLPFYAAGSPGSIVTGSVDFAIPHLWRGFQCGSGLSVEPSVTLQHKNFSGGIWAAHAFNNSYNEMDLWAGYTYRWFNVSLYDYFCPPAYNPSQADFTILGGPRTFHYYSLDISYLGTEKIPVSLLASTMFLGADFHPESMEYFFSTYLQAAYNLTLKSMQFQIFTGGTPAKGGYAQSAAIINTGISCKTKIRITSSLDIPFKLSVVFNPDQDKFYLSAGISLNYDYKL